MAPNTKTPNKIRPEGEQLWDLLMLQIEPDLVSSHIPALDFIYFGESDEQHAARMQRYEKAFETLKERAGTLFKMFEKEVATYKRAAIKGQQNDSETKDDQAIRSISASIDTL